MRALRPIAKLSCLAAAAGVLVPSAAAQETACDALTRPAFEESIAFDSHGEQVGFQLDRAGARLPFDLEADQVSEISGNALLPGWGVPCGYGREANLFARQVELSFGTAELRPPSFNEGRGDGEDNDDAEDDGAVWRSFTTLGAGFADSSGLVGGRWEAAYAGAYDSESGEFEGFLGGRGQISLFDERLTASGDLALSRDDQAGETASAALTRLDLNILRGGALELTGYGTYGVIGAGFSDDDIDYEGDREITALGATLTWDRADLAFEHSRARDNLSGAAPETRRWSVWQGELGYNPDGAHALLPERISLDFEQERSVASGETGATALDQAFGLGVKWALDAGKLRLRLSQWDYGTREDGASLERETGRKIKLGFARGWRDLELGAATSLAMIESDEEGVADTRRTLGFDAGLAWSPGPFGRLAFETELDLEHGGTAGGLSLEGLGLELSYELRF